MQSHLQPVSKAYPYPEIVTGKPWTVHGTPNNKLGGSTDNLNNDTSLVEDAEERISIRAWREFFDLQDKGFSEEQAGKLIFADKAEELVDAITLSASE